MAGLANLKLIFEGGIGHVDAFEVAGADLGPIPAGFSGNFALGSLVLGGVDVGYVQLVDQVSNRGDGGGNLAPEALYVHDLILGPGCLLDLNGLNLYYWHAQIDPGAAIDLKGEHLMAVVPEPSSIALIAVLGGICASWRCLGRRRGTGLSCIAPIMAVSLLPLCAYSADTSITYKTIALSGQPAPGAETGVTFFNMHTPAINSGGAVAFAAALVGPGVRSGVNDAALYLGASEDLRLIARTGQAAPDCPPYVSYRQYLSMPSINRQGQVAFFSNLSNLGDSFAHGVFAGQPQALRAVARTDLLSKSQ